MAKEISRTFDMANGAVVSQIQDLLGNTSFNTLYLAGVPNVDTAIAALLIQIDANATLLQTRMVAAGWIPPTTP